MSDTEVNDARIRVMRVIARLNVGGPAIHATLLTERLEPARFHTSLVAGSESENEANYLDLHRRSLPVRIIPDLGREIQPAKDLRTLWRLIRLIRRERPHIVHTHAAKAGALGRAAAIACGVPVIVHTYHGHVLRGYFSPRVTAIYRSVERALARRTHRIVTVADRVSRELLALGVGVPDQYTTVPLGLELAPLLDAEHHRGECRSELQLGAAPLVGIVARLVPIKAHDVFLAMAARVQRELPDARFVIVGDGELRGALEAQARERGLSASVLFLGWRADLARLYADLDVVVLTSRNEGSPVALIEAMAAARPVVSTDVGGVSEVVRHGVTGLLAPMDDDEALAGHVLNLVRNPARAAEMGRRGREHVSATYGADRLVRDVEALYEELLRERGISV